MKTLIILVFSKEYPIQSDELSTPGENGEGLSYLDKESTVLPEGLVEAVTQVAVCVHVVVLAVQTQTGCVSAVCSYKCHLSRRPAHVHCSVCRW